MAHLAQDKPTASDSDPPAISYPTTVYTQNTYKQKPLINHRVSELTRCDHTLLCCMIAEVNSKSMIFADESVEMEIGGRV